MVLRVLPELAVAAFLAPGLGPRFAPVFLVSTFFAVVLGAAF